MKSISLLCALGAFALFPVVAHAQLTGKVVPVFGDTFNSGTASGTNNTNNIDANDNNAFCAPCREYAPNESAIGGESGAWSYNEPTFSNTGSAPNFTQLDNGYADSLLIAEQGNSSGLGYTWVSPNFNYKVGGLNEITVNMYPNQNGAITGSGGLDGWAAMVVGAGTQGALASAMGSTGLSVLDRREPNAAGGGTTASFQFYQGNTLLGGYSTAVTAGSFDTVQIFYDARAGAYTTGATTMPYYFIVDGSKQYAGTITTGWGTTPWISLEATETSSVGLTTNFFQNFSGYTAPGPSSFGVLSTVSTMALAGLGRQRRRHQG